MMHPDAALKMISQQIGYGVFATRFIPKGTIVYVKDPLEIVISQKQFKQLETPYQLITDKYSYIDENGSRVLSWDLAKYVNHSCDCNTMSSGYGFEIAIKDIAEGEEITDEYGLFNLEEAMVLACDCENCRKILTPNDIDRHYKAWDSKVVDALSHYNKVDQPLVEFMDPRTLDELNSYLKGASAYKSVKSLKFIPGDGQNKIECESMAMAL